MKKTLILIFIIFISMSFISCDNSSTNKYANKDEQQIKADFNAEVEKFDMALETYKAFSNEASVKYQTYHELKEDSMTMSHNPVNLKSKIKVDLNNHYFYTHQNVKSPSDERLIPNPVYKGYELEMDYINGQYIKTEGWVYDCIKKSFSTEEDYLEIIETMQETELLYPEEATYAQIGDKTYTITFEIEEFDELNPDIFKNYFKDIIFRLHNQEKVVLTFDFISDTSMAVTMEFDPMKYVKNREDYYVYLVIEENIQISEQVEKEVIEDVFYKSAISLDVPMFTLSAEHSSNLYLSQYNENFYKYVLTPGNYTFDNTLDYDIYNINGEIINYEATITFDEETTIYINYTNPALKQYKNIYSIVKVINN